MSVASGAPVPALLRELLRFSNHHTTATMATMTISQRIQSIAESFCPWHLSTAVRLMAQGNFDGAREACELVLLLDQEEPRALTLLEDAHRAQEEQQVATWLREAAAQLALSAFSEANALVARALELRPYSSEAARLKRSVTEARQRHEEAQARIRAVKTAVERAAAHLDGGAYEAALRSVSEALALDPLHTQALDIRGRATALAEGRRAAEEAQQREIAARLQREAEERRLSEERRQEEARRAEEERRRAEDERQREEARRRDELARQEADARGRAEEARRLEEERRAGLAQLDARRREQQEATRRAEQDAARRAEEERVAAAAAERRAAEQERRALKAEQRRQPPPQPGPGAASPGGRSPVVSNADRKGDAQPARSARAPWSGRTVFAVAAAVIVAVVMIFVLTRSSADHLALPPAVPASVTIDIAPWATIESIVRVSDGQQVGGGAATPATVDILPGHYRVKATHPSFPPYEFDLTVEGTGPQEIRRIMPEFDAEKEVSSLLGR